MAEFEFENNSTGDGPSEIPVIDPRTLNGADNTSGSEIFDPAVHATRADGSPSINPNGTFRRRRGTGAARRTYTGAGAAPRSIPVSSYAGSLIVVHAALAGALNAPELAINQEQGDTLAKAIAEVQSHYGSVLDPKTEAWVKLAIVAGSVYVPKVIDIRNRIAFEAEQRRNALKSRTAAETTFGAEIR